MYKSAVYDAKLDDKTSFDILVTSLVLETGLPFEYFENLDLRRLGNIVGFKSGKSRVEERKERRRKRGLPAD